MCKKYDAYHETNAIKTIVSVLEDLEPNQRTRVMAYVDDVLACMDKPAPEPAAEPMGEPPPQYLREPPRGPAVADAGPF